MLNKVNELIGINISKLPEDVAINTLGTLIDMAGDLQKDDGTTKAFEWCDELEARELSEQNKCLIDYYRANCWANLGQKKRSDKSAVWSWEQQEIERQIFYLRRAISRKGFVKIHKIHKCQIINNLANQLNSVGRFVEALEMWSKALAIEPMFGVSLGNRGYGYVHYARAIYDKDLTYIFLGFAHSDFKNALCRDAKYYGEDNNAKQYFNSGIEWIESLFELKSDIINSRTLIDYKLGDTREEVKYRKWCLDNILFLNPINDIKSHSVAAVDSLVQPPIISSIEDPYPPATIGFFSQIKQEFVTSRWMYYHGITTEQPHFSDKDVTLINTLDYPGYSYSIEHIKSSFRTSYSILDKIAFLLNHYFSMHTKENKVSFRSIWYSDTKNRLINECFEKSENWPLRGLFWLSKDIYEPEFQDVLETGAKELNNIRNHLEHKYLRIHQIDFPDLAPKDDKNKLGRLISRSELEIKALRMLKLARAGLIYLSLGLHAEEKKRKNALGEKFLMPMVLDTLEDEWKS